MIRPKTRASLRRPALSAVTLAPSLALFAWIKPLVAPDRTGRTGYRTGSTRKNPLENNWAHGPHGPHGYPRAYAYTSPLTRAHTPVPRVHTRAYPCAPCAPCAPLINKEFLERLPVRYPVRPRAVSLEMELAVRPARLSCWMPEAER